MDRDKAKVYNASMNGQRIRAARLARSMTLKQLGDAMGVTPQAVAQWEKTKPSFDHYKLNRLSEALSVDEDWFLLDGDVEGVPTNEELYRKFRRIPIISRDEAFLFSIFRSSDGGFASEISSLEPTVELSTSSFATVIELEDEVGSLLAGDVAIFDANVTPKSEDIVMYFSVENAVYRGRYIQRSDLSKAIKTVANFYKERNQLHISRGQAPVEMEAVAVLAVLVEFRRLRPL